MHRTRLLLYQNSLSIPFYTDSSFIVPPYFRLRFLFTHPQYHWRRLPVSSTQRPLSVLHPLQPPSMSPVGRCPSLCRHLPLRKGATTSLTHFALLIHPPPSLSSNFRLGRNEVDSTRYTIQQS